MKKTIIAGAAASAVLAAMPIVGAFAAIEGSPYIDKISVTVVDSCTLSGTRSEDAVSDTYSKTLVGGSDIQTLGTTTLKVVCNTPGGFTLTGAFDDLTSTDENNNKIEFAGTTALTTETTGWAASKDGVLLAKSATILNESETTTKDGKIADITYTVSVKDGQPSGTYKGNATYTLSVSD